MINAMMTVGNVSKQPPDDTGQLGILIAHKRITEGSSYKDIIAYKGYPYPKNEQMGQIEDMSFNIGSITMVVDKSNRYIEIVLFESPKYKKIHFMASEIGSEDIEPAECFYDSVVMIEGQRCYKYIGVPNKDLEGFIMGGVINMIMRGYRLVFFYSY